MISWTSDSIFFYLGTISYLGNTHFRGFASTREVAGTDRP